MATRPRRPGRWWRAAWLLVLLFALDWLQTPSRQLSTAALLVAIDVYQATLSPWLPSLGVNCRFEPTCSHYGEAALRSRGLPSGAWLAAWRILRCGPWTRLGTRDPPPGEVIPEPAPSAPPHS